MITLVGTIGKTDCKSDCKVLTDKADKIIADLHDEINTRKQLELNQANQIVNLNNTINDKNQELSSIWKNPWFVGTLGVLVGGAGAIYLMKR